MALSIFTELCNYCHNFRTFHNSESNSMSINNHASFPSKKKIFKYLICVVHWVFWQRIMLVRSTPLNSHLFSLLAHESKIIIPVFLLFLFLFHFSLREKYQSWGKITCKKADAKNLVILKDQQVNMKGNIG